MGSYNTNGVLEITTLNSNIKKYLEEVTTDDATEFPLTVTYTATGNSYTVDATGNIYEVVTNQ